MYRNLAYEPISVRLGDDVNFKLHEEDLDSVPYFYTYLFKLCSSKYVWSSSVKW